jgi:hypothetical protein
MTGARGCAVTAASPGEGKAGRAADSAAGEGGDAVRVRGISRPSWCSKPCLITKAGDFSPDGEITRPRVQVTAESGKMRGFLCPRGYLTPALGRAGDGSL